MTAPEELGNDPDLDVALAGRAINRAMRGTALAGGVLGVLALAFLVVAGGELGPQSIPQLVILGIGWAAGVLLPVLCVRAETRLRAGRSTPLDACLRTERALHRAIIGLPLMALVCAASLIGWLTPRGTTALSVVVALAILSQAVVVMVTLRSGLRRAARRIARL